jgi:hypothetical protein
VETLVLEQLHRERQAEMMRMFWSWAAADPDPEKRNSLFDQLMNMYKRLVFPWEGSSDKAESMVEMYNRMIAAKKRMKEQKDV